tara:strand:+ start:797 stop:1273 length:477 start_codon:yes stop_codon:yes gene_type:complete
MSKKKKASPGTVAQNKKASHEYSFSESFEAGMELQGWEVKSVRAGKVNITEAFIQVKDGQAFAHNILITPLVSASTHVEAQENRPRRLLLNKREINHLIGAVERDGFTLVATSMYWKKGYLKLAVQLAKGKKLYDKRHDLKEKDWQRQKQRDLKGLVR